PAASSTRAIHRSFRCRRSRWAVVNSGCCCGGSPSGWLACPPSGPRGCWCSARAWAPGPAPTSSCSRASRASTTTASTGPCGWGCRGWPSGPAAAWLGGAGPRWPRGPVGAFAPHEPLAELDDQQRARLRAVILSHDNDPIAVMGPELLIKPPWWLADGRRGRGVPEAMRWRPLITFIQTAMDAANAMVSVPGKFGSFGHDYRADMARFVQDAFRLPAATEEQLGGIEETLRSLELERAERIKARDPRAAPTPPAHRGGDGGSRAGVPLATRRTRGARRGPRGGGAGPPPPPRRAPRAPG